MKRNKPNKKRVFLWKTLKSGMKSEHGDCTWRVGKWKKIAGKPKLCEQGFHASESTIDAISYVKPYVIALVEVRGESDKQGDKQAWSEMRIEKAWNWTKRDSVLLAIFAAESVIALYGAKFPNDNRPIKAIESAREWLNAQDAGRAAHYAAYCASCAAHAADAAHADAARVGGGAADSAHAADAARAAAFAAYYADAADYAARYADYAAYYADYAARYADAALAAADAACAARKTQKQKMHDYIVSLLETKEQIK